MSSGPGAVLRGSQIFWSGVVWPDQLCVWPTGEASQLSASVEWPAGELAQKLNYQPLQRSLTLLSTVIQSFWRECNQTLMLCWFLLYSKSFQLFLIFCQKAHECRHSFWRCWIVFFCWLILLILSQLIILSSKYWKLLSCQQESKI